MRSQKPKLDLSFEVRDANGATYTWGPNERSAQNRAQGFTFREKIGEGFSDASLNLSRRIDLDWPDLALVNDFTAVGADGTVAYEGEIAANPRNVSDRHQHSVTMVGHIEEMRDEQFTAIYVDRDQSAWGPMSVRRRAQLLPSSYILFDPQTRPDPTNGFTALSLQIDGVWVSPFKPIAEAWYDAGTGNTVRQLRWRLNARGSVNTGDAAWDITPNVATDDAPTSNVVSGSDFTGATPGNETTFIAGTPGRFAFFQALYNGTPAGGDGLQFMFDLSKVAVYGTNLPQIAGATDEPPGVVASDVLRDIIGRYCPRLDASGIEDTTYAIQHLAYKDLTFPYDAALDVNKFHLWGFGVWERKRVVFAPYDLTDAKWQVRTDDPGVEFSAQGASVDDTYNGVTVRYQDVLTGRQEILTPDTNAELADTDEANVWTRAGIVKWRDVQLSTPQTSQQALEIGRAALADTLRPKAPGAITVRGHIRDRAGNWHPAWAPRAGESVALTNLPNDQPRLITETSFDDDSKTLTMSLDAPASTLDALNDRLANALQAAGLA